MSFVAHLQATARPTEPKEETFVTKRRHQLLIYFQGSINGDDITYAQDQKRKQNQRKHDDSKSHSIEQFFFLITNRSSTKEDSARRGSQNDHTV